VDVFGITIKNVIKHCHCHWYLLAVIKFITSMSKTEYLSKDMLEEEFVKMFSPYHKFQKVLGCSRVESRDRFISPPTYYQKLYTVFYIIVAAGLECKLFKFSYDWYEGSLPEVYSLCLALFILQLSVTVCNVVHARFFNAFDNTQLYIKMQNIERSLKLDKDLEISKMQYTIHLAIIVGLILIAGTIITCGLFVRIELSLILFALVYIEIPFNVEINHCCSIMTYFTCRVQILNSIMWNYLHRSYNNSISNISLPSNQLLRLIANRNHNYETFDIDNILKDILKGFKVYSELYTFQVCNIIETLCPF
jgi:hypothetical protein